MQLQIAGTLTPFFKILQTMKLCSKSSDLKPGNWAWVHPFKPGLWGGFNLENVDVKGIISNDGMLILDFSKEAMWVGDQDCLAFHKTLDYYGIAPNKVILISQNLSFKNKYENWCRNNSMRPIWYLYAHYYSAMLKVRPVDLNRLAIAKGGRSAKAKLFTNFNYFPRPHRLWLAGNLYRRNLIGRSYFSYPALNKKPELLSWCDDSFEDMRDFLPSSIDLACDDSSSWSVSGHLSRENILIKDQTAEDNHPFEPYLDSYFSVVGETDFSNWTTRFTEKIYRPIYNLHPFIVAGNFSTLTLLRQEGFKTFDPWIDESYDLIDNPELRLHAVLEEITRLGSMLPSDLEKWFDKVWPVVEFNFFHFAGKFRTEIQAEKTFVQDVQSICKRTCLRVL